MRIWVLRGFTISRDERAHELLLLAKNIEGAIFFPFLASTDQCSSGFGELRDVVAEGP